MKELKILYTKEISLNNCKVILYYNPLIVVPLLEIKLKLLIIHLLTNISYLTLVRRFYIKKAMDLNVYKQNKQKNCLFNR